MTSLPPVANEIRCRKFEIVSSQTILPRQDQAPITFEIEGRDDCFVDLKNIEMAMEFLVLKFDGANNRYVPLPADEDVTIYNGFLYTFWKVHYIAVNVRLYRYKSDLFFLGRTNRFATSSRG